MENSNQTAFPFTDGDGRPVIGLTKREYFAGLAMQGILAQLDENNNGGNDRYHVNDGFICYQQIAKDAIGCADELLKHLEKPCTDSSANDAKWTSLLKYEQ